MTGGVAGACHDLSHIPGIQCLHPAPFVTPSLLCILQGCKRLAQPCTGTTQKGRGVETLRGASKQRMRNFCGRGTFYKDPLSSPGTEPQVLTGVTSSSSPPFSGLPFCPFPPFSCYHLSDKIPVFKSPTQGSTEEQLNGRRMLEDFKAGTRNHD